MKSRPEITDAERQIMAVLWQQQPQTAREICEALSEQTTWNPKTVHTLITRLHDKGMLERQADGRRFLYATTISEEDFLSRRSRQFVRELFNGRLAPLVACFAEKESLSKADLEELRRVVDGLEADDES